MTGDRWERIKEIYSDALELPDTDRSAFLARECAGAAELMADLLDLLAHAGGPSLLADSSRLIRELLADSETPHSGSKQFPLRPDSTPLAPGETLGPYRIVAPLGKGGMGQVYRALDPRMGREVAIKVVEDRFSRRFAREVRAIAAMNHPNICTIHDVGPNYLVMEYVDGVPLKGPMPEGQALAFAQQIAAGLEAAHAKGIIHRDLKPANVLRTSEGVKLLDFGIAILAKPRFRGRIITDSPDTLGMAAPLSMEIATQVTATAATRAGETSGTPSYMSPEQAAGQIVDPRSDIFSFGAVLYEILSGQRAFARNTARETMLAVQGEEPPRLEASPETMRVVARCLHKSPAERYQNAAELREALETAAAALLRKAPCVAVLPFSMASPDPENEYFSDGLTEEIINALSSVTGLKVIARTSTFAFKRQAEDVRDIAHKLAASHVMEGSVRMAAGRIRITTRLIAARDGTQLWANRYDRELQDIFVIQDEIANAIATELKVNLTAQKLVKPATAHLEAYREVLRGRYHWYRFHPQDLAKALACFQKAVAIDPDYPAAHIGIAMYHWGQMIIGLAEGKKALYLAADEGREALRLDPSNAEAQCLLGAYHAIHEFQWAQAERHFRRGLELNPNSFETMNCYTHYCLVPLGRLEEALKLQDLALTHDPLAPVLHMVRAVILECKGRLKEQEEALEGLSRLDPTFDAGQFHLTRLRAQQGRSAEALEIAEQSISRSGRWSMTLGTLGIAHAAAGNQKLANDIITELPFAPGGASHPFYASLIAAAMGDASQTFRWAAKSLEQRDHLMPMMLRSTSFDPFRSDPRYARLLRLMKMAEFL
jgi:eukaryotic-like serine/threonine-protein kinase